MDDLLSGFWYKLNSDILLSSEDIAIIHKSLFLHIIIDSSLFFCSKQMKATQMIKIVVLY